MVQALLTIDQAAARLHDIRESVCKALAEIPVLLNNTKLILGAFKKSKELHLCSSALYVRTLGALEHIICWYQEKAASTRHPNANSAGTLTDTR